VPGATAEDSPIEAAQNTTAGMQEVGPCREQLPRMFCEAGPVKRQRAAREVLDAVRDRGARKPNQQSPAGSPVCEVKDFTK
jgi:hypothetical protein